MLLLFTYGVSLKKWEEWGIITREISLYKQLSNKNVKYKFLTYGNDSDLKYQELLGDIEIIPTQNLIKSKNLILRLFKSFLLPFKLKKIFKSIDIIKTNQVEGCWVGLIAKIFFRKKIIIRAGYEWFRNYLNEVKIQSEKNFFRYLINYIYIFITELIAYKFADIIILTSRENIKFIIKTFKLNRKREKIIFLPNFIDVNQFKPLNIKKKEKSILFVGRLTLIKNLANLLKALKNLNNFTLDLIGTGSHEVNLKNMAKNLNINANFLGVLPNYKLSEKYNLYQMFILPSFFEVNPKALLEAMSCGMPCIGTNVRGIKEIIKHKENGYLCELSSKSIQDAIITVYNNKELREIISNNARQFIMKNCSLDSIVEKELNIYKEILRH
ncbi:MAG: glycosyltransferase family 4 protein [Promethearchaeota archaeon]